jgi:hypothetical protein
VLSKKKKEKILSPGLPRSPKEQAAFVTDDCIQPPELLEILMAIPKYDEIMLPLLKVLSDGQAHTKRELAEKMADHFRLTPEEREQCSRAQGRPTLSIAQAGPASVCGKLDWQQTRSKERFR